MTHLRLRTQLFIATLLIICGLTGALLLIIRHTVSVETEQQVRDGTEKSVRAFESVQRQREQQLSRTAAMLADLPIVKAQMTTEHALTIQDASTSWWKLAGSDLFILALPDRRIVAFHVAKTGLPTEVVERDLKRSIEQGEDTSWWYDNGRLYEVFLRTITAGEGANSQELGFLAIGYQVDSTVAEHLALVAGNQIALATGDTLIASTLPPKDEAAMQRQLRELSLESKPEEREITLATDEYAFSSVLLHGALPSPVRCYVMMPLRPVNSFMLRDDAAATGEQFHEPAESNNFYPGRIGGFVWGAAVRFRFAQDYQAAGQSCFGSSRAGDGKLYVLDHAGRGHRSRGTERGVCENAGRIAGFAAAAD